MTKTNTGLIEYARQQLGKPYWWGTYGQIATEELLQRQKRQYPSHYPDSRMARYRQGIGKRVHDCNGMVKAYLWQNPAGRVAYNPETDWNANGTLQRCREKGPISTIPEIPGVLVFFPGHVGVYEGNGNVIEAMGFNHGVVRTRLSAGRWQNWGKHPMIEYQNNVTVEINGKKTNVKADILSDNRTYVQLQGQHGQMHWIQLRAFADLLQARLEWDGNTRTAKLFT